MARAQLPWLRSGATAQGNPSRRICTQPKPRLWLFPVGHGGAFLGHTERGRNKLETLRQEVTAAAKQCVFDPNGVRA